MPMARISPEQLAALNTRHAERLKHMTYEQAAHAMQSGVDVEMTKDSAPTEPKHLRVGITSAMVTDCAIARLMIAKGIITEPEYLEAVRVAMIDEVRRYEMSLYEYFGQFPTLV